MQQIAVAVRLIIVESIVKGRRKLTWVEKNVRNTLVNYYFMLNSFALFRLQREDSSPMNFLFVSHVRARLKKSLCPWSYHIQRMIKLPIVIRQNCFCLSVSSTSFLCSNANYYTTANLFESSILLHG